MTTVSLIVVRLNVDDQQSSRAKKFRGECYLDRSRAYL
jgi:hypothetical protein